MHGNMRNESACTRQSQRPKTTMKLQQNNNEIHNCIQHSHTHTKNECDCVYNHICMPLLMQARTHMPRVYTHLQHATCNKMHRRAASENEWERVKREALVSRRIGANEWVCAALSVCASVCLWLCVVVSAHKGIYYILLSHIHTQTAIMT